MRGGHLRLATGDARGRLLYSGRGLSTRPTPAGLREALVSMIRPRLAGAAILDLYAGFGTVALELLSCGAAQATLVERDRTALSVIRRNVELLGWQPRCELLSIPVSVALPRLAAAGRQFGLVFVDPPYETGQAESTLTQLSVLEIVPPGGLLLVQHALREDLPAELGKLRRSRARDSGETRLSFYEWETGA
ncbi:MAG: 16S rRNA (guanine(966)-N(2))-methyltransferase RsmD [Fimbriimonadaceae bacterium]|nr:16S rRNA (guanine(966)-N(2))-methyltransferase RsmD [Fimbriimonadaceae bacterium]